MKFKGRDFETKFQLMKAFALNVIYPIVWEKRHVLLSSSLPDVSILVLTHWGRVTHICVSKLTIIGSDNGFSPGRYQASIWTNAGILLIGPIGANLSEFLIIIHTFSFNEMHLKMSSAE